MRQAEETLESFLPAPKAPVRGYPSAKVEVKNRVPEFSSVLGYTPFKI